MTSYLLLGKEEEHVIATNTETPACNKYLETWFEKWYKM